MKPIINYRSQYKSFKLRNQGSVPWGFVGSLSWNPAHCTKVGYFSKGYDVDSSVLEKVAFTGSFTSLIFVILFVALSIKKPVIFPSHGPP